MNNYRQYGPSPYPIAVIHGGPGAGGEMAPVARELHKTFSSILEPIQTATSLHGQIQELHEVLLAQCNLPVTLLGYSWGAWLSIFIAAAFPDLVKKLVLIGCPPFEQKYVPQIFATRMKHLDKDEQVEFQSVLEALSKDDS